MTSKIFSTGFQQVYLTHKNRCPEPDFRYQEQHEIKAAIITGKPGLEV